MNLTDPKTLISALMIWIAVNLPMAANDSPEFPDLTQTDPKGEFARGGKSYCGPVAVSNSLMWLYRDELKRLGMSQYDLVNQIASGNYMKTDPVKGTGPNGLMVGVRQFLKERSVKEVEYSLKFQGWRSHREEFSAGISEPELSWIREALASGGAVWLNLGWYKKKIENGSYERIGGHWVTVVGNGQDEDGKSDPAILIVHDPAPRAGKTAKSQAVKMVRLESGELVGKTRNLPRLAAGLFQMAGEMTIKESADCAILDGVVALRFLR